MKTLPCFLTAVADASERTGSYLHCGYNLYIVAMLMLKYNELKMIQLLSIFKNLVTVETA